MSAFASLRNGASLPLAAVPVLGTAELCGALERAPQDGLRLAAYFALAARGQRGATLVAVLADDLGGELLLARAEAEGPSFPSIAARCPQAQLFEREIAEQCDLRPEGHPWLKPLRFAPPLRSSGNVSRTERQRPEIGLADFYRLGGEEVHEVAVGPVHAGVIEPGHFRFQCHGEHVFHLEISLGYQHRGVEEALLGGPHKQSRHQMETLAGDTTIAHTWAYCQCLEALAGALAPARAQVLRAVAIELARLANHSGDLGALAGDVGYLPTQSFCGRLRGDFLNLSAALCGSRFGRGLILPGGVRFDLGPELAAELERGLDAAERDLRSAVELLWDAPSVVARFEGTGALSREACLELGLVGPAARACGVERDVRNDHPCGVYQFTHIPVSTAEGGDVHARAFVRWLEIQRSLAFVRERLSALPETTVRTELGGLEPERIAVSLIEAWRGEACHVAITDEAGRFARYKVVDPSFHNWAGLALAMREQQISDFPLCNKSFNLSYCGHDL